MEIYCLKKRKKVFITAQFAITQLKILSGLFCNPLPNQILSPLKVSKQKEEKNEKD